MRFHSVLELGKRVCSGIRRNNALGCQKFASWELVVGMYHTLERDKQLSLQRHVTYIKKIDNLCMFEIRLVALCIIR